MKFRKTPRGMPKFLNGWLERNQNRGRNGRAAEPPTGRGDGLRGEAAERTRIRSALVKRHGIRDEAELERLVDREMELRKSRT